MTAIAYSFLQQYQRPQSIDIDTKLRGGRDVVQTIYGGLVKFGPVFPGAVGGYPSDNSLKGPKGQLVDYDLWLFIPDQDRGVRRYPAAREIVGVVATASIANWTGDSGEDQKVVALDDVRTELWDVSLRGLDPGAADHANL